MKTFIVVADIDSQSIANALDDQGIRCQSSVELTSEELECIRCMLRQDVQNFYDDPTGWLGAANPHPASVRAEVDRLTSLLGKFGLDFSHVAREEATDNEIERVQMMMGGE